MRTRRATFGVVIDPDSARATRRQAEAKPANRATRRQAARRQRDRGLQPTGPHDTRSVGFAVRSVPTDIALALFGFGPGVRGYLQAIDTPVPGLPESCCFSCARTWTAACRPDAVVLIEPDRPTGCGAIAGVCPACAGDVKVFTAAIHRHFPGVEAELPKDVAYEPEQRRQA